MRGPRRSALPPVAAALLLSALPAGAQEASPLITDRPDFTESASVVPMGLLQVEAGYSHLRAGDLREHTAGEVLVRVPLASRLELRVGLPSWASLRGDGARVSGLGDASLGAKAVLLDAPAGPGVRPGAALLATGVLPTGADGIGSEAWQPEARLALAWSLPGPLSLASNLGWARPDAGAEAFHQGLWSLSAAADLGGGVGAYAEGYGFTAEAPGGDATTWLNAGVTWEALPGVQLDARAGARTGGRERLIGVGVSWRR